MKNKQFAVFALTLLCAFNSQLSTAHAQGTAFTYQGQFQNNGSPASGTYNLTFTLFNTNTTGVAIAGPVTNNAIFVTNGLFMVLIDFGPGVFNGTNYWLQIGVETNGASPFTTLAPRQQLTPTPYAIFAESSSNLLGTLPAASLGGTYGSAVTLNNAGNSFSGSFAGNGTGVTNVNAAALDGLNATNFWQLGGNNVAAGQFLGSTNNQPLEIRVGGVRAGWISPSNGLPDIVFGPAQNSISNTTAASSILGGINNTIGTNSSYSVLGGGYQNSIQFNDTYSALVGGYGNSIQSSAGFSTLGGGFNNSIQTSAAYSFLGGGNANSIQGPNQSVLVGGAGNIIQSGANDSFLGGGYANNIDTNATYSVLGGGQQNNIQLGGAQNFLGGGYNNTILSSQSESVLVGGNANTLGGTWAFLGGGSHNTVVGITSAYAVLGGGGQNSIQGSANYAVLGGGADNIIQGNSYYSVIDGGYNNVIQGSGYGAVLVGGYQNSISNNAEYSFLGGGQGNFVGGYWATLGGGYGNIATNSFATVPGGSNNVAGGPFSFAAGANAQANNSGAFVWADAEGTPFSSTTSNQFNVRANGGIRFVTGGAGLTVDGQPVLAGNITLAQLPAGLVTNNEPNVSLGILTLSSNLNLPVPAAINSGGQRLAFADNNLNSYFGIFAGVANQGTGNTGIGFNALLLNAGSYNTALGGVALIRTSGSYNTANGYAALSANLSGTDNTADGANALEFNTNGSDNVAIGFAALANSTNDNGLVAIGYETLQNDNALFVESPGPGTISGFGENTAIGYQALQADTYGYANTAVGSRTLALNQNGYFSTAIGDNALKNNTTGYQNTVIGYNALAEIGSGNNNIALGYNAGVNLGSGNNDIYIGNAGNSSETGIIRIGTPGIQTQTLIAGVVGINNNNPTEALDVGGEFMVIEGLGGVRCYIGDDGVGNDVQVGSLTSGVTAVSLFNATDSAYMHLNCSSITIEGGADLAEPFQISKADQPISEGEVVVIDEANPGQLKLTDRPYDTRVAGVVSGANGIHPGIQMQQQGLLEDGKNVALTAVFTFRPIRPMG